MPQHMIDEALRALHRGDVDGAGDMARVIIKQQGFWVAEAVHILASIALLQGRFATAVALIGRVLQKNEGKRSLALEGRLHQTLGRALLLEKQYEAARAAFTVAVTFLPEEAAAHAGLGEAYLAQRIPKRAIACFKKAVTLAPQQAALWSLLAQAYHQNGARDDAVEAWEMVITLAPHDRAAWANYGGALFAVGAWDKAASALETALDQGCYTPQTLNNMGLVRGAQGAMKDACSYFEKAYHQSPDDPDILINWNAALYDMGKSEEAEFLLNTFEEKHGTLPPKARFNKAALLLERGEWREGWRAFEARRDILPHCVTRPLPDVPVWQGDAGDEPIAVHAEQGLGDTIQFLRFLPDIMKRRPVRLQMSQEIKAFICHHCPALLEKQLWESDGPVVAQHSLLSTPYILDMNANPSRKPYLYSSRSSEEWLIGICWAGNASYAFNRRRSIPVALLEPLQHVAGVRFLSLQQHAEAPEWMERSPLASLRDLSHAVGRCALVISVDTLVAHMAGAQGRPLWLLNRQGGDWRWKQPFWYHIAQCFQAEKAAPPYVAWPPVIQHVVAALEAAVLRFSCAEKSDEEPDRWA